MEILNEQLVDCGLLLLGLSERNEGWANNRLLCKISFFSLTHINPGLKFVDRNAAAIAQHLTSDVLTNGSGAIQLQQHVGLEQILGSLDLSVSQTVADPHPLALHVEQHVLQQGIVLSHWCVYHQNMCVMSKFLAPLKLGIIVMMTPNLRLIYLIPNCIQTKSLNPGRGKGSGKVVHSCW